jgi:hypothetical protein
VQGLDEVLQDAPRGGFECVSNAHALRSATEVPPDLRES